MAFATVNSQEYPSTDQLMPSVTGEPSKKKRGRPSKADQEIRAAEAAARGEVYPPPKKHKTPRQSMEGVEGGAPTAIMSTPDVAGPKAPKDTYANEKRGRSSNGQGQARTMSLEDTAKAAEQIRGESGIGRGENFSEPPASEIAAPAALLAGVQEHAARIHDSDALMKDTAHTEISGPPQRYSAPGQGDWATYQQTSA
ncbi:hypothetical protein MMC12_002041 [Toensbergia leucococca]|nr:hypothetical protein [Toensbergia leucococca]